MYFLSRFEMRMKGYSISLKETSEDKILKVLNIKSTQVNNIFTRSSKLLHQQVSVLGILFGVFKG